MAQRAAQDDALAVELPRQGQGNGELSRLVPNAHVEDNERAQQGQQRRTTETDQRSNDATDNECRLAPQINGRDDCGD